MKPKQRQAIRVVLGLAVPAAMLILLTVGCGGPGGSSPAEEPSTPESATSESGATGSAAPQQEPTLEEREQQLAEREAAVARRESQAAAREERAPAPSRQPSAQTAREPASPAVNESRPVVLTVPSSTQFDVEFLEPLSSETSQVGDGFQARLMQDITTEGQVAVPAGSLVLGQVTEVQSTKKIGGQARLTLSFDRVELPSGESTELHATMAAAGKSQTKKDAATIGGATAGGAILGRILDKKHGSKGTALGAIVGAAVGTAIASKNEGDPVNIDPGSVVALSLDEPLYVVVENGRLHFDRYAMQGR